MIFDTHAHYDDPRYGDLAHLVDDMRRNGVSAILTCATDYTSCETVLKLAEQYDLFYAAVGIYPHEIIKQDGWDADRLRAYARHPKVVAIGEIGLDYHYDFAPRDVQKRVFAAQLELAAAARVPVLVHDREAHGDCMDLLRAFRGRLSGVMHCFSGSYETARECIDAGLHIAFGGALTFKNASTRRDIAARLPLDRLLLETDCPYMAPEPFRGTRNDPRRVRQVLEVLAAVRQQPLEAVAAATTENALRLFCPFSF